MSEDGRRRILTPGLITFVAAAFLVAGAMWAWLTGRAERQDHARTEAPLTAPGGDGTLPLLGEVPDFALVGSDGTALRRRDLDGVPWVASFIFTTCAGVCPLMSARMAALQERLPDDSPVRLISITVDPLRDTPEVLSLYARRFNARPGRWLFLTGDPREIYRLAEEGFHLGAGTLDDYDPDVDDGPFFHSSRLTLVDREGRIRGYYEGTDEEQVARLEEDLRRLTP